LFVFFSIIPRPPISTLFPYTTLFRSDFHRYASTLFNLRTALSTKCFLSNVKRKLLFGPFIVRVYSLRFKDMVLGQHSRQTCVERSEEHTSELQSRSDLVCRLLLEKKK